MSQVCLAHRGSAKFTSHRRLRLCEDVAIGTEFPGDRAERSRQKRGVHADRTVGGFVDGDRGTIRAHSDGKSAVVRNSIPIALAGRFKVPPQAAAKASASTDSENARSTDGSGRCNRSQLISGPH